MPAKGPRERRILSRIAPDEFVGRTDALQQIIGLAATTGETRGLLLLAAPAVGTSELLRQAYDELFERQSDVPPIYFAFTRSDKTNRDAARRFLHTFLWQLVAFRRHNPSLIHASLPLTDLTELAAPSDYEWMARLIEAFERERTRDDERSLVRLCLSAPVRAAAQDTRTLVLLDSVPQVEHLQGEVALGTEIAQVFMNADTPFVLAGFRRQLLDVLHGAPGVFDHVDILRLERLGDEDARALVERRAARYSIPINDETRDLMVQQSGSKPFFINALLQAARAKKVALTSFRNCQQLYVDEMLGGAINRYFTTILEEIAPQPATRRALLRMLYESLASDLGQFPLDMWRKRLALEPDQYQRVIRALYVQELISLNANFIEVNKQSSLWSDYIRACYRMDVAGEPRALVVAEALLETLKRAPQTMARRYRREAALGLRDLLSRFNWQRVPASLLHYDRFSHSYKGREREEIATRLDAETDLILLPQIVHTVSCASLHPPMRLICDEERCAIGYGFNAGTYAEANQIAWLAVEIESKLAVGRGLTEVWCDRLMQVARACGLNRVRLWLVSAEGFSAEANHSLAAREAYGSSRQQLEFLTARLDAGLATAKKEAAAPDEFELVIPMGGDAELIAANTVDQIARRIDFQPEAINQIKTALIEACINATEHSLSLDRKIYQRFRVENDRLVITVSSRGAIPPNVIAGMGSQQDNGNGPPESPKERRGWELTLIRTLMDEVEFERVDDGTRLRMTKYLRK